MQWCPKFNLKIGEETQTVLHLIAMSMRMQILLNIILCRLMYGKRTWKDLQPSYSGYKRPWRTVQTQNMEAKEKNYDP